MNFLTLIACGLVAVFCVAAVWSHKFTDTLPQRIALGVGCVGAMGTGWYANQTPLPGPVELLIWALALFCAATWHKLSQERKAPEERQQPASEEPDRPAHADEGEVRTANDWYNVLCMLEVKPGVAAEWAEVFADVVEPETFSAGDEDLSAFLGQILHESAGLTRLQESLTYSAERLTVVWPGRFPTKAEAQPYANNPEALANKVYGGRMGNTEPGDGWKYRGRGPLQITGRDNYRAVGEIMGQDLEGMPELLEQPRFALEAAIAWWEDKIPDSLLGDIEKTTRRVNGGTLGLAHREDLTDKAREALA